MTELKKLLIESLYYHQEAEAELAIKCVKEWLAAKSKSFTNNPEYFSVTNFEIACKKDFIAELLTELSIDGKKETVTKP